MDKTARNLSLLHYALITLVRKMARKLSLLRQNLIKFLRAKKLEWTDGA
jgi:hypothetical protein